MRLILILSAVWATSAIGQQLRIGSVEQKANCAVAAVTGNVTIVCPGLNPQILSVLNEQFKARIRDRDLRIDQITAEANDWKDRYLSLSKRLEDAGVDDALTRKANDLLKEGKLDEAGQAIDQALVDGESAVDQQAKRQYDRALIFDLQFKDQNALAHLERAYSYRPDNPQYCEAYALALETEQEFAQAETVFRDCLNRLRGAVKTSPNITQPYLAMVLLSLGEFYQRIGRPRDAYAPYAESISLLRKLADQEPKYLNFKGIALTSEGEFFAEEHRLPEADSDLDEALRIFSSLSKSHPDDFKRTLASTYLSIGILRVAENQPEKGLEAYNSALRAFRELEEDHPGTCQLQLAATLEDLGNLYSNTKRPTKAAASCNEAISIRRSLVKIDPDAFLPYLSKSLDGLGNVYRDNSDWENAVAPYEEALSVRSALANKNRPVYLLDLAVVHNQLGIVYYNLNRTQDSIHEFNASLQTYRELAERDPDRYLPDVASMLANLGMLYRAQLQPSDSESNFKQALQVRRDLAKKNPQLYNSLVADILGELGQLYANEGKTVDAKNACAEARAILKQQTSDSSTVSGSGLNAACADK